MTRRGLWKLPELRTHRAAPTAPWKTTKQVFHSYHRPFLFPWIDSKTESVNLSTEPGQAHGSKRAELRALFAANRRLFKAYVLREQLDRLWTYKTRPGVLNFLNGWIDALRWQRLPEMVRLGEFLFRHIEGIAAYCDHPVRFGVVESINTTIKAVLRRARGMRDEAMLVLKLRWATARPIRSARDVVRFLHPETMHSLR